MEPKHEGLALGEHKPLLPSKYEQHNSKLKDDAEPTSTSRSPEDTNSKRPYRDTVFTFLFLGSILTTYGFGIVAVTRADFNLDSKLKLSQFNRNTNQCELVQQEQWKDPENSFAFAVVAMASLAALALAFPVGLLILHLLHRYTRGLVLATGPLLPLVPLGMWVVWLTSCYDMNDTCAKAMPMSSQIVVAVYFPILSAMLAYQLWKNRSKNLLDLTVQLLTMATQLLQEHFSLLLWNTLLFLGSMVLVTGSIFSLVWYALHNGRIVPNFEVVNDLSKGCDQDVIGFPCCQTEYPEWSIAYFILAGFTFLWVVQVTLWLQVLAVSGTVSLWYFAPDGSSTASNVKRSFRIAFGPSFGTACNLGTVVTMVVVAFVGFVKTSMTRVSRSSSSREGLMSPILQGCLPWMLQLPECHPKFAPHFAAISGDSFWESSKKAHNLLRRNSLSLVGTNMMVMATQTLFLLPSFYIFLQSLLVYGVMELFSNDILPRTKVSIALTSGGIAMVGLIPSLCAIPLVIDTVYICYAMEKDVGEISRPEVCQAFMARQPEVGVSSNLPKDIVIV